MAGMEFEEMTEVMNSHATIQAALERAGLRVAHCGSTCAGLRVDDAFSVDLAAVAQAIEELGGRHPRLDFVPAAAYDSGLCEETVTLYWEAV